MRTPCSPNPRPDPPEESDWLRIVRKQVEGLRFGVVQIIVHEGRVTQIERTEKTRLESRTPHP